MCRCRYFCCRIVAVVVGVVVVAIVDGGWRVYEREPREAQEHETARHSE